MSEGYGPTGDLVAQCECGNQWLMDYEPSPEECSGSTWRLGIFRPEEGIDWGAWVDQYGDIVDVEEGN